jgi:CRISPR-associated protein Csy1
MTPVPEAVQARELHKRGDLAQAIEGYGRALEKQPEAVDVWHLTAMAEHQAGRLEAARASIARAIAIGGARPVFLMLEGGVLHDMGDLAGAAARFARAALDKPEWAAPHLELGRVRLDQGRPDEALRELQAAVNLDPKHVRGWNNLGIALQSLDRLDDALRAFNHALAIDARYPLAHFNVARIHNLRGDSVRALEHAEHALRANDRQVEACLLVGDIHRRNRDTAKALAAYSAAVRADPADLNARLALAELIAEAGGVDEARGEYARIWQRAPGNIKAALGTNLLLPQVYSSVAHLDAARALYAEGLERLHEAADHLDLPGPQALGAAAWTNFYLAYQGREDRELQARYGAFQRRLVERAAPELLRPRSRRAPGKRIRVGFASHFFFNCTAGRYFMSWVTRLDRERFESVVYYTNKWVADDTRTIAAAASRFRHLPGRPVHTLAREIAGDDLDILVYPELGMHPETFLLAAMRLAPVQCAGWGHPDTTGQAEIDWFISCGEMEPADAQEHYTEKLALLPGLGTRYTVPKADEGGTRADFGLPENRTLYLVPQSLFKIHPDNDDLIARVLARDPQGIAVLFASHHEKLTETFATRLAASFERHGLDIHERTRFLAPFMPHGRYLQLNRVCDLMLDTLHWSGGNTSLDALSSGLPVVTLPGRLMRGRQSQAMLRIVDAGELVARDVEEYLGIAERLGRDAGYRAAIAARIRANLGHLFERDEPVRALEDFLERAAREG